MKKAILLMCFGFFGLAACTVSNEFIIRDPEKAASSAEILLCNKRLPLAKSESEIRGTAPITCEGTGSILVHLLDGRETVCRIGYVTPGAEQTFEFVIEKAECRSVMPAKADIQLQKVRLGKVGFLLRGNDKLGLAASNLKHLGSAKAV